MPVPPVHHITFSTRHCISPRPNKREVSGVCGACAIHSESRCCLSSGSPGPQARFTNHILSLTFIAMRCATSVCLTALVLSFLCSMAAARDLKWAAPAFCKGLECPKYTVLKTLGDGVELRRYEGGMSNNDGQHSSSTSRQSNHLQLYMLQLDDAIACDAQRP